MRRAQCIRFEITTKKFKIPTFWKFKDVDVKNSWIKINHNRKLSMFKTKQ